MKILPALSLSVAAVMLLAAASASGAAPATAPGTAPSTAPAPAPNAQGLTAAVIANKDTYTLDPAQSGKDFRDHLDQIKNGRGGAGVGGINRGGALPPPPIVDLILRLTNASDVPVTISVGGDDSQVQLKLQGPGAVTMDNLVAMTMEFRIGTPVTIAPGKTYDIPISALAFGMRGISQCAYWTEPGDYSLTAELVYGMGDGKPQGRVTSGPAKLKVVAPPKQNPLVLLPFCHWRRKVMVTACPKRSYAKNSREPTDFGAWLSQQRLVAGLSVIELATKLGTSVGNLNDWQRGARRPTQGFKVRIEEFFGRLC